MKIKLAVLAFFLFFAGNIAYSATKYYLPQVVVGSFTDPSIGNASYRTTFLFFNNQDSSTNITLALTKDDGTPMSVTIPGLGTKSTFSFTLSSGATRIIQTDNSGTARAGAATVTSDLAIGVSGAYTIYDAHGNFKTEAGVGNSDPLKDFVIPVQIIGNYNTGMAWFNPSTTDSSITVTLTSTDGTVAATTSKTLAAGRHTGFYIGGDLFPNITSFQGMLRVQSTVAISAMTLRQNTPPLSYTSCPVIPTSTTQKTFNLAHIANGSGPYEGYKTTFMLLNPSSGAANITIAFKADSGSPLSVTIPSQGTSAKDTFNLTLGAGKSLFLQTDGTGPELGGAAVITSDVPIGAAGIFTELNPNGDFATEAGVQASQALTSFTLPIDSRVSPDGATTTSDTGIAFFNPNSSSNTFYLEFLDADGVVITTTPVNLPANGHAAYFFNQLFPGLGNTQGSVAITGLTNAVSAMTLRMNMSPFRMTTLPVVAGTAPGLFYAESGTYAATRPIYADITANMTINRSMNYAFALTVPISGIASGTYTPIQVQAISSSSGRIYRPKYDVVSGTSATVPLTPGMYTLRAMGWMPGYANQYNGVYVDYTTDEFFLANTTSQAIDIPQPTYHTVTGTITGFSSLGITTSAGLSFYGTVAGNSHIQYVVYCSTDSEGKGTFTQSMPDGNYIAILQVAGNTGTTISGATENMSLQNIGVFSVNGTDTTVNLTVPALATLSGTASFAGGTLPMGKFTITAQDNFLPNFGYINTNYNSYPGLNYFPRNTTWTQDAFGGAYSATLGAGSTYNLRYSMIIYNSDSTAAGTAYYSPSSGASVNLTASGNAYNFDTLPQLPSLVTVTGKVKNALGTGFASIVVARSDSIIGTDGNIIPGLSYYATTTADSSGNYSLSVLPGRNYQLYYSTSYVLIAQ
jgi:hypothetical protein